MNDIYAIFDTQEDKYVSKSMAGYAANKSTWLTTGAAKRAALTLPGMRFNSLNPIKRFKDQSRYQVHKMKLTFIEVVS